MIFETFNAQNWDNEEKALLVADLPDFRLLGADYKQIEAVLTAFDAKDADMMQVILEGGDLHAMNAAAIYGCDPTTESASEMMVTFEGKRVTARYATKRFTHGHNFGMGPYTMSKKYGISVAEARRLIAAYARRWPAIFEWKQRVIAEAARNHILTNPFGRIRRFWTPIDFNDGYGELHWADAEKALAFYPQSTAGDMFKIVLAQLPQPVSSVDNHITRVWTGTHDSYVIHCHKNAVDHWARFLKRIMEQKFPQMKWDPFFPDGFWCKAEFSVGHTWKGEDYEIAA